jgi:hypothetical protein
MNNFIGGVGVVSVNHLAKQLHIWSSLKHGDEVKPSEITIFCSIPSQIYVRA